ncbi:MAG: ATP-dependent RecD-like DNA helicase [Chloroflexi bacterium]|nr:ATP-dependent RecD-like DNA helicase [Chloroflexota bacterium]
MDHLEGTVERITFFNPDNGYSVLRMTPARGGELVTVIGNLPEINPGEHLRLEGEWTAHAEYGRQFKAAKCEQVLPATVEGIRRYLGSGLIKGIGPKTAEKIVDQFGPQTLYVIESEPQRLREVADIGPWRQARIHEAWEAQKAIKEVMIFLQGHGITTGLAVKVYKQYGDAAIDVVKSDPYRLARDIWGIGFKTADKIARALGLPADSPMRVDAGLVFALSEMADDGHVFAPENVLTGKATELLGVKPELFPPSLDRLAADDRIRRETLIPLPPLPMGEGRGVRAVYLAPFFHAEVGVASRLAVLIQTPSDRLRGLRSADWAMLTHERPGETALSPEQAEAVKTAVTSKVMILTGGPGTGKTTSLRAVIQLLDKHRRSYLLASPTGRAAKRLSEATGKPAATIHRLLGYSPIDGFKFNENNRLPADMIVADEMSMADLLLMNNLLKAIHPASHLLLVGDMDQLPSVGAGNVLRDLVESGRIPVARLSVIFRQAAGSYIITNAHRVNRGEMPLFPKDAGDFFLFTQTEPEAAADWVVDVVQNRIPQKFGFDATEEVQVLSPMHRGPAGVSNLNQRLQAALNPPAPPSPGGAREGKAEKIIGGRVFRVGDKLMQLRNNYQKDVYNGDIGRLVAIDFEEQTFTVSFDGGASGGRPVFYDWAESDELMHAYAVSIHKAQGSEHPAVVIPILTQHYMLLQRNLLYTAITRARRLCVLVGDKKAIGIAVRNAKVAERWSGLQARLVKNLAKET